MDHRAKRIGYELWRVVSVAAILLGLGWLAYGGLADNYDFQWAEALDFLPYFFWNGLTMTLVIALIGGAGATAIGLVIALGRLAPWGPVRDLAGLYVHGLRNIPFVVVMFIFFFGLREGVMLNDIAVMGYELSGPFGWGVMALAVYYSSYMAEIIRSGIQSVPIEQTESARSLGMTYLQTMHKVILPQALKVIIPPSTSVLIGMIKDSALLSIIGVAELTRAAIDMADPLMRPYTFEFYIMLAGFYLAIVVPLSFASQWLEGRLGSATGLGEEAARGV